MKMKKPVVRVWCPGCAKYRIVSEERQVFRIIDEQQCDVVAPYHYGDMNGLALESYCRPCNPFKPAAGDCTWYFIEVK